jgi:NAD(P)-dependent dehydrogenase (short-subunit alcohol dehydrogenase family)
MRQPATAGAGRRDQARGTRTRGLRGNGVHAEGTMSESNGRVVVITGAGSGIGRATALRFARDGDRVVAADINGEAAAETARLIGEAGGEAWAQAVDVAARVQVADLVQGIVERYGAIDVMVANAGIGRNAPFLEVTEEDLDRVLDVNLKGVFWCGQLAARAMVDAGRGGVIINTASTYAEVTRAGTSTYTASKGGVRMLTKAMALELGRYGIRVAAVGPGWIRTGMNPLDDPQRVAQIEATIPLGRVASGDDVAGAIFLLASDDAGYISGDTVFVDGGWLVQ